jgi:hypothetical protein
MIFSLSDPVMNWHCDKLNLQLVKRIDPVMSWFSIESTTDDSISNEYTLH